MKWFYTLQDVKHHLQKVPLHIAAFRAKYRCCHFFHFYLFCSPHSFFIQSKTQLDSLSQRLLEVTPLTPSLTLTHPPEKLFAQPSRRCITRRSRLMPHTHSARLSPERIGAKAPKFYFQNTWRCNGWQRVASQRLNLLIESRHACCFESACERRCRRSLILIASRD